MTDQETALTVFVRDRDRPSRRRNQSAAIASPKILNEKITAESTDQVQVDLESTFLQASDPAQANPSPAYTAESRDPDNVDASDRPDVTNQLMQILSGKSSYV